MDFNNQEIWVGVEDLTNDKKFIETASQEFPMDLTEAMSQESDSSFATNRRDFLKYLGFGVGAATVAASCEIPVKRAIPYVTKPDTIVPGVANYYASSFVKGGDYASILVKTREGRPIKIEGNTMSGVTNGGTSARVQAAVLDLYDTNRIQGPASVKADGIVALKGGWSELDGIVRGKLNAGSSIRIVSNSIISPMTNNAIADFAKKYPNTKVVQYDPISATAILEANQQCFGTYAIPDFAFDKADVIVSFGADFLGTWVSPIEFAGKYAKGRKVDAANPKMSRHIQVESYMSLTGSNADNRILIKPSEQGAAIATLYNEIVALVGGGHQPVAVPVLNAKAAKGLKKVAAELVAAKGKSLVVSNSNNTSEQVLVNFINAHLGNIDETIDFNAANLTRRGNDKDVQNLISEMKSGSVNAVIVIGANPVFELSNGAEFAAALKTVGLTISTNGIVDETTAACQFAAPMHNFLESWGDANPKNGHYSLIQPTISPLFNTRQAEVSLLSWAGTEGADAYEYLKALWQGDMFKRQREYATFQAFWDATLHDGVFTTGSATARQFGIGGDATAAAQGITQPSGKDVVEVTFFETVNLGNGQYAQNPWLQEMPDPVTRTVWTNTLALPVTYDGDKKFGTAFGKFEDGDIVSVEIGKNKYECVVVRQFGQPENTAAIALGYGRQQAGTCSGVGTNVNNAIPLSNGLPQYFATAKIGEKVGKDKDFACVQHHHTMGLTNGKKNADGTAYMADEAALAFQGSLVDRTIIRQGNLKEVKAFAENLKKERANFKHLNDQTLYRGHQDRYLSGLHWSMHVDLNACVGCGACTVACMAENNVPVVGKHEVQRHHEMTWIHISRFYYGDVENPNVVYQPMMCQHCDNAPCENVCPVNATNHSSEGLNQMTYNRCIGTRYCANNCPYKVRRFNWQDYTTADIFPWNERKLMGATLGFSTEMPFGADNLTRMVLNPDVTVRTRGVIEKCSFCVQRIQEGKLTAKKESRQLNDGDVKTACQSACPTGAITFGNRNDKESSVSKAMQNTLNYRVLEEVNTDANVMYAARVTNKVDKLDS